MALYIDYVVLDVGQGSGNFVEIRNEDNKKLVSTILIDLGSERKPKKTAGGPSVEYVVTTLKELDQPTIEALIFSHSDSDHINLMPDVLAAFKPYGTKGVNKKDTLKIDRVWYGGDYDRYKKHNKNVLDTVKKYMPDDSLMKSVSTSFSSYKPDDPGNSAPLITVQNDVDLYMLMGNAPTGLTNKGSAKKKVKLDGFAVNTMSLVINLDFAQTQILATGDATGSTLVACNTILNDDIREHFYNDVFMVTLPHHGSATTTFDIKSHPGTAEENLKEFSDNVKADTITGSAERVRTFKHPSAIVMSYFFDNLSEHVYWADELLDNDLHFYTAFFLAKDYEIINSDGDAVEWPLFNWWYSVRTSYNVYTNLYYDYGLQGKAQLPPDPGNELDIITSSEEQPALGVAWIFRITSDGKKELLRYINRESMLALREAIYEGVDPTQLPVPTGEEWLALRREMQTAPTPRRAVSAGATGAVIVGKRTESGSGAAGPSNKLRGLRMIP